MSGELTAADCDIAPLTGNPGATGDVYRFTTAAKVIITASAEASGFVPSLWIADAAGQLLGTTEPQRHNLTISLEAGDYLLAIAGEGSGAYTLTYVSEEPRICSELPLIAGEEIDAPPREAGCRALDLVPFSTDERLLDVYSIRVEAIGALRVETSTGDIEVYGSESQLIAAGQERAVVSVDPGEYRALIHRADPSLPYRLRTAAEPLRSCESTQAQPGGSTPVLLSEASCRVLDFQRFSSDESYVQPLVINIPDDQVLAAKADSTEFPATLHLFDTTLSPLSVAAGARLLHSLPPGTYLLLAGAQNPGQTGPLQLTLELSPQRACKVPVLEPGASIAQVLDPEDCRMLDLVTPSSDASPVDLYHLAPAQASVLLAELGASESAPLLILAKPDRQPVAAASKLELLVLAEPLLLMVTGADGGGGQYELKTSLRAPRECSREELKVGDEAAGELSASGCTLGESVPYMPLGFRTAVYRLQVPEAAAVRLEVASEEIIPGVLLYDEQFRPVASAWQYAAGQAATVDATLEPATYTLLVFGVNDSLGRYTVSARAH